MAEPFSIATGAAGLLSLGIEVTKLLFKFYTEYKGQDEELASVTKKLDDLRSLFNTLGAAVEEQRLQADTQNELEEVDKAVLNCDEVIKKLQFEREKFDKDLADNFKDRVRVAGRRAAYPFRKPTIETLEKDVNYIRTNLEFALSILNAKKQSQIQSGITKNKALLEQINADNVSFSTINWLRAPDPYINHYTANEKCHPNTGLWFINSHEFKTWLEEEKSFLWLNGFAGCGKSVLCSTAIQHVLHTKECKHNTGVAFYYFSFNEEAKQDDHGMLRTLLLQLSEQRQDNKADLENLHAKHKMGTPPLYALNDLLQKFLQRFQDVYILIDALDESPQSDRKRDGVLRAIRNICSWKIPGVHLLVTSRNNVDIREVLKPSDKQDIPLRNPEVDRDIENFVSYQLRDDIKFQRWKEHHSEIQDKLAKGAQGVFRYVECQFNALRQVRNRKQLRECLNTLPDDLNETYDRILRRIEQKDVDDARRVLTLLCCSARQLTVNELLHAHAIDLNEPPQFDSDLLYEQNDIVDICLGLIEIAATRDKDGQTTLTVGIAHFSVQEYLESDYIKQSSLKIFAMQELPANTEMAQICLVYLLQPALSEGKVGEPKGTEFPFAHFAAEYWFQHYSKSRKEEVEPLVLKLFEDMKTLLTWIHLYNMDGPSNSSAYTKVKPGTDMSLPPYFAALLGLESVLNNALNVAAVDNELVDVVNTQGREYGNMLQATAYYGHQKIAQMLLDSGAKVNAQGGKYGTAIQAAALNGHEKVVQMLLDSGAKVNAQGGEYGTAIQAAALNGHEKVVQMLLDNGANANAQGGQYGYAIQAAALRGHEKVIRMLLDNGAEINAQGGQYDYAIEAAALQGHEKVVQTLLDNGAEINAQGGVYGNALQAAASEGHENVVSILLNHGVDVNIQDVICSHYKSGNALQAAAFNGHEKVVQMLLEKGADVNAQGGMFINALQAAAFNGHEKVVQMLLEKGADIHAQGGKYHHAPHDPETQKRIISYLPILEPSGLFFRDGELGNTLQAAAYKGREKMVQMFLDKGADINAQGGCFGNALQAAAHGGHEQMVQMFLDKGADINAQGGCFGNALQAAAFNGHEQMVQMFLDKGADINARGGCFGNALHAAAHEGHEKIMQLLLNQGVDINAQGGKYNTVLQATAAEGNDKMVQILLNYGVDANVHDGIYGTALHAAAFNGHEKVVQILLDNNVDANAQGGKCDTALQAAAFNGHEKVVQMLLGRGVDANAQGGKCDTALQAAAFNGHEKVVQILLENDADVNTQGGDYSTALQAAALNGHEKVVQVLLGNGADANVQGGKYDTALHAAVSNGHEKVVQMFLGREVNLDPRESKYGHTPLSLAAVKGHDAIVKLLLRTRKVFVNAKNDCGRTPLFYAAEYGHETVAETILNDNSVLPDEKDYYGSTPLSIAVRHRHVEMVKMLLATQVVNCNSHDCFGRSVFWWSKRSEHVGIQTMLVDYSKKHGIPMCHDEFINVQPESSGHILLHCEVCTLNIYYGDILYYCEICNGGIFVICKECFELKGHCLQDSHEMVQWQY